MPVSPQDFDLYSRVTGNPMPSDAMSRMRMAPDVYKFTKDFARKPNILEKTGNLVKNIGKTVGMGMAVAAASPAYVEKQEISPESPVTTTDTNVETQEGRPEQQETTADNYDQKRIGNQTGLNRIARAEEQGRDVLNTSRPTQSSVLSGEQDSEPAFKAIEGTTPIGLLESEEDKTYGQSATSADVQKFLEQPGISEMLLGAIAASKNPEALEGFKGQLPSVVDHPDIAPGEDDNELPSSTNFETIGESPKGIVLGSTTDLAAHHKEMRKMEATERNKEAIDRTVKLGKELEASERGSSKIDSPNELAGKITALEESNNKLTDLLTTLSGDPSKSQLIEASQARSRVEQKTAAKQRFAGMATPLTEKYYPSDVPRTDIQVGGMVDRKTGLGKSVGMSYTPLNGDTKVGFNVMNDPTKPQEVKTYDYLASPDTMESLQSQEKGSLGRQKFGKLFNLAARNQEGFSGLEM